MTRIKTIALTLAILFGLALHHGAAQARDIQTAIFAGGCFWCVESDFDHVDGVIETVSGYAGGTMKNPTYEKHDGYIEAVRVKFDADRVSYRQLVDHFWRTIDVTDAGGQFCDRGHSYISTVFVSPGQREDAVASKAAAEAALGRGIVTPIVAATTFTRAEDYHQNYYQGTNRVLTRFGWIKQADAYKRYRAGCGRDDRVRAVWGAEAYKGM